MQANKQFHDKIASLSLELFKSLPKAGKPSSREWTVLSCIVMEKDNDFSVIALGTGSKCIGNTKMSGSGDILNDSHAEIMCRRSFLRYLYDQMKQDDSVLAFDEKSKKFSVRCGIKFHFFTTHMPCGDCAIFTKQCVEEFGEVVAVNDEDGDERNVSKKLKLDEDIFRTGAKCLEDSEVKDAKLAGKEYHVLGVVRTKPGRGDRTLSLSCSDKIAKWCHLGIQGSLLSLLLDKPIYLSSFTVIGGTPYNEKSLTRGLFDRLGQVELIHPYHCHRLILGQSDLIFDFAKRTNKQPCPASISWCKMKGKNLEVAVEGKRQGVTKKKLNTPMGRLKICKLELFKSFLELCKLKGINYCNDCKGITYGETKRMAKEYQQNWDILKRKFGVWTTKDSQLLQFNTDTVK